jgi:hypothetical protein
MVMKTLIALTVAAAIAAPAFRTTGSMTTPRAAHTATVLPSGRVLIAGGCTLPGCDDVEGQTASAELYDPKTRRFTRTGELGRIRVSSLAARLPDGRVLVAGGYSGTKATATTELYDERTGRFTGGPHLTTPRADGTATRLADGRILFAGGAADASAEILDPRTMAFTRTSPMTIPRKIHTATLLADGRVLIAGGATTNNRVVASAEVFDPRTGRFSRTGSLARIRYKHAAVRLRDGKVMILGGAPAFDLGLRYWSTEIYDPRRGRFSAGPGMSYARFHIHDSVVRLRDGRVLVAGDAPEIEVYSPKTRRFRIAGRTGLSLGFGTATTLRDGSVLLAGGYVNTSENPQRRAWTFR